MPGPLNSMVATPLLVAGLNASLADAWKQTESDIEPYLKNVMKLGVASTLLTEIYGAFNSAPHPERWVRGDAIKSENTDSFSFTVTNFDYGKAIEWHRNDRADDQTKTLYDMASELGGNFALLPERIFFQILLGTTDPTLLPSIPTAPDGSALFATSRFGLAGGNIVTGSGMSPRFLIRDVNTVLARWSQFQDTKGQPFYRGNSMAVLKKGVTVIFGAHNREHFKTAFGVPLVEQVVSAPSNVIYHDDVKYELWATPRITDDSWYCSLNGEPRKAIFQQIRQGLETHTSTMDNSDTARKTKVESVQYDVRQGYGVSVPRDLIKVSN